VAGTESSIGSSCGSNSFVSAPSCSSNRCASSAAAGLINAQQRGRTICYQAEFQVMDALVACLTENCCADEQARGRPTPC